MTFYSSLLFAKSLVFPRTERNSSARRSLFGAVLCIALSIIPLIIVLCVTDGMISGMTERIIGLSSGHLQAYVAAGIDEVSSPQAFRSYARRLSQEPGITSAFPELSLNALAAGNSLRTGIQIRAVEDDIFERNVSFKKLFSVLEGDVSALTEKSAVIGEKLSQLLDVHAGDSLRVITTRTADGRIAPRLTTFSVTAVVSSGYQELDAFWVFIPLETAYRLLPLENADFTIMFSTKDAFSPELGEAQRQLQSVAGRYANIYRWNQIHTSEYESFSSTKILLVFIMLLIVLVATVNISSAIVMLVMERKKELAILKSIGASPAGITLAFLLAALACACGGILLGLPVGLLLTVNINPLIHALERLLNLFVRLGYVLSGTPLSQVSAIRLMDPAYYLQEVPIELPFFQIFFILFAAVLLSLLVSVLPSVRAGKEKPLDILRKS